MTRTIGKRILAVAFIVGVFTLPAVADASQNVSEERADWAIQVSRGDSYLAAGEYVRALTTYELAAKSAPYSAVPVLRMARVNYRWGISVPARRGDLWGAALQQTERARFLDGMLAEASFLEAIILFRIGDYRGSTAIYSHLEQVRQGDVDLYLDLAIAAGKAGNMKLATRSLEKARIVDPSSTRLMSVAKQVLGGR